MTVSVSFNKPSYSFENHKYHKYAFSSSSLLLHDIYDNLSDQDKANKDRELKDLYEELYNRIDELYNKINDIPKEEDLIKVYECVMNNLSDLKQFVYDYLNNSFNSKPYLQNMVNYKKYLSTLNIINGILEEIRKGSYTDK